MLDLAWNAPPECPTGAEVRAEVERIVGPSAERHVIVESTVRKSGQAWGLTMTTRVADQEGERTLRGATCGELARAAAIVIALTIDPDALAPAPPPPPEPPPPPPPPPTPDVAPPAQPKARPSRVFWTTGAAVGTAFETLPGVAPFASVNVGIRFDRVSARLGGAYFVTTSEDARTLPGAGGDFGLIAAFLEGCLTPIEGPKLALVGCVGAELDRMEARGHGVTRPSRVTATWLAPRVSLVPTWKPLRFLRVVLPVEAGMPLDRPTFVLDGIDTVFRPPSIGLRASLGAEVSF